MGFERVEKAALLLGSAQGPDALLRAFLTYSSEDAGADDAMLYTLDERSHTLVPSVMVGMSEKKRAIAERLLLGEGASGRAAAHKAPIVIRDFRTENLTTEQCDLLDRLGARASLAAPVLSSDGHVLGVIEHHFRQPHRPSDGDVYRATMYARLVAAVIEHVRFRDQQDVREALAVRRRTEIVSVANEVLASAVDWWATLDNVARMAIPALADLCIVSTVDDAGALERAAAAHIDLDEEQELRRVLSESPSALESVVLRDRHGVLLSCIDDDDGASALEPALPRRFAVQSLLVVPMRRADRVLGVIVFGAAGSGRRFDEADRTVAEALAERAAHAIEHGRLFQKMERAVHARDEFLAIASHDLRNLVSAIKMNANCLIHYSPPNDRRSARKQIEAISRLAGRMNELVLDLVDSSTIESGTFVVVRRPQPLRPLVVEACAAMQSLAAERGLHLETVLPPEDVVVSCDSRRIQQVLTNLIGNALKFSPRGVVRVFAKRRATDVCIEVRDEGIGIAPKDLGRIFDRFWRSQTSGHHGVGLGLFIAKSIVEAHGGTMRAESTFGSGSAFFFTLPLEGS